MGGPFSYGTRETLKEVMQKANISSMFFGRIGNSAYSEHITVNRSY